MSSASCNSQILGNYKTIIGQLKAIQSVRSAGEDSPPRRHAANTGSTHQCMKIRIARNASDISRTITTTQGYESMYRSFSFFADIKMKHVQAHAREPFCCCPHESNQQTFSCWSDLINHLESGMCAGGWNAQRISAILCPRDRFFMKVFLIPGRAEWFSAGPPRLIPLVADYDQLRACWVCSICSEEFATKHQLAQHLSRMDCCQNYPNVLRCLECKRTFSRMSSLIRHIESPRCPANFNQDIILERMAALQFSIVVYDPPDLLDKYVRWKLKSDPFSQRLMAIPFGFVRGPSWRKLEQ